ncbi:MAG: flavodoxin family protein [Acidobacteriia bacterium]|nr:flavodoxin family protein [Terriglobia bacterium]
MKKVTAFVGSPRRKHTHDTVQQFLGNLQSLGGVECEVVHLGDHRVEQCRGCCVCFNRGEEFCPSGGDDRDLLIEKMMTSDGVVLASPTYSFQVSAIMKTFLDRLGFVFHRPRFFGKTFTSLVVEGIYGGPKVVEYLDFVGGGLGFNVVKGSCVRILEPMSEKNRRKVDGTVAAHGRRFHDGLSRPPLPAPTFLKLMFFNMARTSIRRLDESYRDYTYYRDKGWFGSEYFYPVRLSPLKRAAGKMFDLTMSRGTTA